MNLEHIQHMVETMLPANLRFAIAHMQSCQGKLHHTENFLLNKRSQRRQREIIAGRILARRVATLFGYSNIAILTDNNGRPTWPTQLTGSITHKANYVAVLIANSCDYFGVGVDLEKLTHLEAKQYLPFAVDEDIDEFVSLKLPYRQLPSLVLSLKEAMFKCQMMAASSTNIKLKDMRPKLVNNTELETGFTDKNNQISGIFLIHKDCVLTCAWLSKTQESQVKGITA